VDMFTRTRPAMPTRHKKKSRWPETLKHVKEPLQQPRLPAELTKQTFSAGRALLAPVLADWLQPDLPDSLLHLDGGWLCRFHD
jgi:hypothetical protein